jgi:hypothetical protein
MREDIESYENNETFASPRFFQFSELDIFYSDNDTFTVSLLTQGDLRDESSLTDGYGILDSFYLLVGFSGYYGASIQYNFYIIGEAGSYDIPSEDRSLSILAGAAGAELDIALDLPLNPVLSIDLFYSTGDGWSRTDWQGSSIDSSVSELNQFNAFSVKDIGFVYNTRAGNIFYGDVDFTVIPSSFFSITASSLTLFRSVNGPVYEIPLDESDSSLYLGEELSLSLDFQIASDLDLSFKGGIFLPNELVVTDDVQYKVSANLTYSFGSESQKK